MNLSRNLFTIFVLFMLTACSTVSPTNEPNPLSNDEATTSASSNEYPTAAHTQHQTEINPTISRLGITIGRWQGQRMLQFPADFPPLIVGIRIANAEAKALNVELTEEQLLSSASESDIDALLNDIAAQIEGMYGPSAAIDFEISRLIGNVDGMHEHYYTILNEQESAPALFGIALERLEMAKSLAQNAKASEHFTDELARLTAELEAWPDTNEAYIDLGNRMTEWAYNAQYAVRSLGTPTPQPTPQPTPALVNQAGTDIKKQLPVGNQDNAQPILMANACVACHNFDGDIPGPPWKAEDYAGGKGIATRAEEIWQSDSYTGSATSAEEYLYEAIVLPNAYINQGYPDGIMPLNYGESLSDQEIADIIAYMLSIE